MQSFILDRHTDPSNPTMKVTQDDKIPIYDSKADAEADLANIEEGAIVATKDTGATEKVVDVVEDGNMNPVTSNAVADYIVVESWTNAENVTIAGSSYNAVQTGIHDTKSGYTLVSVGAVTDGLDGIAFGFRNWNNRIRISLINNYNQPQTILANALTVKVIWMKN